MGKASDAKAVLEFNEGMDEVLAHYSLVTLEEGEPRRSDRNYLVWRFLALDAVEEYRGSQCRIVDNRALIMDSVCQYGYPEHVTFIDAEHPSYPGRALIEVTVKVPVASITGAGR